MARSIEEDLNNPSLFTDNAAGDYTYTKNGVGGKSACGQLHLAVEPKRDNKAQRDAGADSRRTKGHEWGTDDGGHLIGARFGGETGADNLTAQDSNLNRQDYKRLENKWAKLLGEENGYKVFVNIEANDPDRPTAYMGYAIYEAPDGTRSYETFDFTNENKKEQAKWELDTEAYYAEGDLVGKEYDDDAYLKEQFSQEADIANEQAQWEQDTETYLNDENENAIQATISRGKYRNSMQNAGIEEKANAITTINKQQAAPTKAASHNKEEASKTNQQMNKDINTRSH